MSAAPSQPASHHIKQSALTYAAYVPAYNLTDHITAHGRQFLQNRFPPFMGVFTFAVGGAVPLALMGKAHEVATNHFKPLSERDKMLTASLPGLIAAPFSSFFHHTNLYQTMLPEQLQTPLQAAKHINANYGLRAVFCGFKAHTVASSWFGFNVFYVRTHSEFVANSLLAGCSSAVVQTVAMRVAEFQQVPLMLQKRSHLGKMLWGGRHLILKDYPRVAIAQSAFMCIYSFVENLLMK